MSMLFEGEIKGFVLAVLEKAPATMARLKEETRLHKVSVTIAVRDLQNSEMIEHGYLTSDGQWLKDYFPDEVTQAIADAWRIAKWER